MSNIVEIEKLENRTPEQSEALFVHNQIKMHKEMIGFGLAGLSQDLKTVRDKRLYTHLGYETFEEYTETEHSIKARQAYKYIRLVEQYGIEFLHSSANAQIGVTKLLEIAVLSSDEREKVFSENTPEQIAGMSTQEVKALVDEIASLKQQLSFLEEERKHSPIEVKEKPFDEIEAEIRRELEAEYASANDPTNSDEYNKLMSEYSELKKSAESLSEKIKEDAVEVAKFLERYTDWFNSRSAPYKKAELKRIYYKAVCKVSDGVYVSHWDKKTKYVVGKTITSKVHKDPDRVAVPGIHMASLEFAQNYGDAWSDVAILELEVNLQDVIIPDATDQIRSSKAKVLREVPMEEMGEWGKRHLNKQKAAS